MTTTHSQFLRVALSVSALAVSAAAQSLFSTGQIVMAEGDPIPGIAGAVNGGSSSLDFPAVDLAGNLLFRARFTGGGATSNLDDRAYFLGRTKDTLQLLLRSGDPEPSGTLGAGVILITQSSVTLQLGGLNGSPRISPEGSIILFGSGLIGPGLVTTGTVGRNDSALFVGQPGAFQVLAQRGTPTGAGGTVFETAFGGVSYQTTCINSSGVATFQATLSGGDVSGTTNNFATFTGTPGALSVVMRKGDIVPVAGGGSCQVGFIGFNNPINRTGMVLHDERFNTTGGTTPALTTNDSVLMVYFPGGTNIITMREGDQAAGLPVGVNYGSPTIAQGFGEAGGCAFGCTMTGAVTTADDTALFLGDLSGFSLVWREGTANPVVPGALNGVGNSTSAYSDYQGGSLAFYGTLVDDGSLTISTTNDQAIWLGRPGNLQMLAREGDAAPGFSNRPGFVSATFGSISAGSVQMNDRGHINFSNAAVTVVDAANPAGVTLNSCHFTWDPINGLQLLFAAGDSFALVGGPTTGNSTGGSQFPSGDGSPIGMNNQGDLAQRVNFTTGGAIVRTHVGSNVCYPSSISGTVGGVHTMELDAGGTFANQIYLVLCGGAGSRPGFTFGGSQIDLNIDPVWTSLSFNSLNTAPWAGTFGLLDANGRATATFTCPPNIFIYAPQDLRHVLNVVDLNTLQVPFSGEPCSMLLY